MDSNSEIEDSIGRYLEYALSYLAVSALGFYELYQDRMFIL